MAQGIMHESGVYSRGWEGRRCSCRQPETECRAVVPCYFVLELTRCRSQHRPCQMNPGKSKHATVITVDQLTPMGSRCGSMFPFETHINVLAYAGIGQRRLAHAKFGISNMIKSQVQLGSTGHYLCSQRKLQLYRNALQVVTHQFSEDNRTMWR